MKVGAAILAHFNRTNFDTKSSSTKIAVTSFWSNRGTKRDSDINKEPFSLGDRDALDRLNHLD